jgi:hypothetical protein
VASKTVVELYDDLDGGHADETVSFGLDGVDYTIDLSTANAAALRRVLAGFIPHARRVSGRSKRAAAPEAAELVVEPEPPRERRRTEREVRIAKAQSASVTEEIRRLASESASRAAKAAEQRAAAVARAKADDEGTLFAVGDPTPVAPKSGAAPANAEPVAPGPVPALMIPFQEAGL